MRMTAYAAEEEGQGQEAAPPAEAEEAPEEDQEQMCGQKKPQPRESECDNQREDVPGEATPHQYTHTMAK